MNITFRTLRYLVILQTNIYNNVCSLYDMMCRNNKFWKTIYFSDYL